MDARSYTADLRAGFVGLRFLPNLIGIGHNNLNPKLILHPDYLEYRGAFFTSKLAYAEVEKVEAAFIGDGTNNLTIIPTTGLTTFTGNFRQKAQLYQFLTVLATKGCPLTPLTQQIMAHQKQLGNIP